MRVVSNTSPLSNLAIIDRLELLREQFGRVLVPFAVQEELRRLPRANARAKLDFAFEEGWLERLDTTPAISIQISEGIHHGEAAAIASAIELKADLVLLDDSDARRRATSFGLSITGVLGILLRARLADRLPSLAAEIKNLRNEARFFVGRELEKSILAMAGE